MTIEQQFKSDDTSLALPSEDRLTSPESNDEKERRTRVEQQVQQLTLSRKAKRPTLKGSVSISQLSSSSTLRNRPVKVVSSLDNNDLSGFYQSVRRMDVSNWPGPGVPHANGGYGMYRYASSGNGHGWGSAGLTLPLMRSVSSADRLHSTFPLQHSVCSEVPRNTQFTSNYSKTLQLPSKMFYKENPDDVFLLNGSHMNTVKSEHELMYLENQNLQRAFSHQEEGVWGTQNVPALVWEKSETSKRPSQTPSLASMQPNRINTITKTLRRQNTNREMTLRTAVHHLTDVNIDKQIKATNFIQNQCFSSAEAKKTMFALKGISKLLKLLDSDNEEVQQAAASALRNVLYENNENKMEVKDCDGVTVILRLLTRCHDIEMRRQLTGLVWNLSSHDMLKEQLGREAVQPLTDNVLVPCSGIYEGENPKLDLLSDPEVFLNATGCLRNVSSAGPNGRMAMRKCDGLIDSLVYYVRGTIADHKTDDQALENCVCILHNLTYQFETEIPENLKPRLQESRQNAAVETQRPGCLIMRNSKLAQMEDTSELNCPMLLEKPNPQGVEWLWSSIIIRMYLSLLATSNRQLTQEASIGAMQNLTAGSTGISQSIASTIVQKEGGLLQVKKMLQEAEDEVKRASVGLLKNISRYRELHPDIIEQTLPELVVLLPISDMNAVQRAEVTSVCQILNNLSQASLQNARTVLDHGVLPRIIKLSSKDRYGSMRTGQAASLLLHTLWRHSELHGTYKKAGYRKADFINNRTVKAVKSTRN